MGRRTLRHSALALVLALIALCTQLAQAMPSADLDGGESRHRDHRQAGSCSTLMPSSAPVFNLSMLQPGNVLSAGGYVGQLCE